MLPAVPANSGRLTDVKPAERCKYRNFFQISLYIPVGDAKQFCNFEVPIKAIRWN